MIQCERCHREFPFQWKLDRHLSRKFPCKEIQTQNQETIPQNQETLISCKFCLKEFSCIKLLNRHTQRCKLSIDYIRELELQLGIELPVFSKTKCRFCNQSFSQVYLPRHLHRCKAKKEYQNKLEKQLEAIETIQMKPKRKNFTQRARMTIASRQDWKCNSCAITLDETFQVDHIIEIADGGETVLENGQALCPNCHSKKTHINWLIRENI